MQKAKWLSKEALQIAVKRREVKSKGEKERYLFNPGTEPRSSALQADSLPNETLGRPRNCLSFKLAIQFYNTTSNK